jgi:hypothetical protein
VLILSSGGCQVQTNEFALCEALQQQGSDATCWLRGELAPVELVAPKVLFGTKSGSLGSVLEEIARETRLTLQDGTAFENEVSRFTLRCARSSSNTCAWTLVSNPKGSVETVFADPIQEVIEWLKARASSDSSVKLSLLEREHLMRRSLSVEIKNNAVTIEWSDSDATLSK